MIVIRQASANCGAVRGPDGDCRAGSPRDDLPISWARPVPVSLVNHRLRCCILHFCYNSALILSVLKTRSRRSGHAEGCANFASGRWYVFRSSELAKTLTNCDCSACAEGVGKSTIITSLIKESFVPHVRGFLAKCEAWAHSYRSNTSSPRSQYHQKSLPRTSLPTSSIPEVGTSRSGLRIHK